MDKLSGNENKNENTLASGHPIHILMEEHKLMLQFAEKLKNILKKLKEKKDFQDISEEMREVNYIIEHFKDSESHYVREENVLFPYLEKYGITQPPVIMWMEHDKIRGTKKELYQTVELSENVSFKDFTQQLEEKVDSLSEILSLHFHKENNILFPLSLKTLKEEEWRDVRNQFDELGYCCFTPLAEKVSMEKREEPITVKEFKAEGIISFETGSLKIEEIDSIFNTLPVDITFIDKENTVKYFSQTKERIFPRAKAVINLKVQQCHPQKSLHLVNQVIENLKSGRKDVEDFWISYQNKFVYIRYFAVRNKNGEYLGCLEVTQDITDIKKIEGEKRLMS